MIIGPLTKSVGSRFAIRVAGPRLDSRLEIKFVDKINFGLWIPDVCVCSLCVSLAVLAQEMSCIEVMRDNIYVIK